ncbi:hypothetical protein FACS189449_04210 [Alphaproteobacteria bacterium]|nr:hypothetical protein FACS189449_04210 [Alphaproteobacteria bacterium]
MTEAVKYFQEIAQALRLLHNEIFFARARKNAAQDRSVLGVHEDLSSGSDEANCKKEPLCSSLKDRTVNRHRWIGRVYQGV